MLVRSVMICLIAGVALVIVIPRVYEHLTGVGVIRPSSKKRSDKSELRERPSARAYIIGSHSEAEGMQAEVPIYSVNDIYASVGVGPDDFIRWQNKYGFETFGRNTEGMLFIPNYPVLSKVAWMGIEPIDLSPAETSMLIEECTAAKSTSVSVAASTELEALITLAQKAVAVNGTVRFGLP